MLKWANRPFHPFLSPLSLKLRSLQPGEGPGVRVWLRLLEIPLQQIFWQQVESCQSQILDGPGKVMRWGVPDGFRDPLTGELVHDDLLISASLVAVLDSQSWGLARSQVANPPNLFDKMGEAF